MESIQYQSMAQPNLPYETSTGSTIPSKSMPTLQLHNNATLIDLIISTPDEEALALKACGDKLFKFQLYFESQIFQKRRQQYI